MAPSWLLSWLMVFADILGVLGGLRVVGAERVAVSEVRLVVFAFDVVFFGVVFALGFADFFAVDFFATGFAFAFVFFVVVFFVAMFNSFLSRVSGDVNRRSPQRGDHFSFCRLAAVLLLAA